MEFDHKDIVIDTYRAKRQGAWVNCNPVGVRVTHKPTGIRVDFDKYNSTHKNKVEAIKELVQLIAPISKSSTREITFTTSFCLPDIPAPENADEISERIKSILISQIKEMEKELLWGCTK